MDGVVLGQGPSPSPFVCIVSLSYPHIIFNTDLLSSVFLVCGWGGSRTPVAFSEDPSALILIFKKYIIFFKWEFHCYGLPRAMADTCGINCQPKNFTPKRACLVAFSFDFFPLPLKKSALMGGNLCAGSSPRLVLRVEKRNPTLAKAPTLPQCALEA